MSIHCEKLGRQDFRRIWDYQRDLFDKRLRDEIPDTLLLVEHFPVYTIGKTGSEGNIVNESLLSGKNRIPVVHIDRGGDITFHGPGQIVGYPVLKLDNYYRDVHRYLRDLEEVLILTLNDFGITGEREEGLTGVWVNGGKVAAIGVKVSRWVTMHGFALNVATDLGYFHNIVPCGISDKKVTSVERIIGRKVVHDDVADSIVRHFNDVFVPVHNIMKKSEVA
ncbi:lipoyl(octanoyl) transferase LipB [candidate division KSB1 bacterium]